MDDILLALASSSSRNLPGLERSREIFLSLYIKVLMGGIMIEGRDTKRFVGGSVVWFTMAGCCVRDKRQRIEIHQYEQKLVVRSSSFWFSW